jgi:hypothetical protein
MKDKIDLLFDKFEAASAKRIAKWKKDKAHEEAEERKQKKFRDDFETLKLKVMRPTIEKLFKRAKQKGFKLKRDEHGEFEQYTFIYTKEEDTSFSMMVSMDDFEGPEIRLASCYNMYDKEQVDFEELIDIKKINSAKVEKEFTRLLAELSK